MAKRHLKQPKAKLVGKKVQVRDTGGVNTNARCPDFCFHYTQKGFTVEDCDKDAKVALISALWERSRMTWMEIMNTDHKGAGAETIPIGQLKKRLPVVVTDDVRKVYALRFGQKRRLVGFRVESVFHIVWVDPKHAVYDG